MSALYPPYDIAGQTALITGASSGIGEAAAWRFAEAGCKLVLTARRYERLQQVKKDVEAKYKVPVFIAQLDMRDLDALHKFPEQLPEEFSEVDILLNNAGLALGTAGVQDNDIQDAINMMETNVTSVIAITKLFVQGMIKRNKGHILFLSSVAGHESYAGGSVYCATKHALDAYATAARHDLVGTNIRVTAISPGAVKTEFSVVRFKGNEDAADAVYKGIIPLTAADIADNILYACTRPVHVQIADIVVYATYQSSAKGLARVLSD